ncbi:MAG: hypothetical protein ALECFALPRED_009116 [Alectoria fallacina]|uniref:Uncharacterized protein n=1 Tax=Alectoria fallacina TaxID=1903189 RepID=A0A8H3F0R5_9LECA|nr:MAG: hypothetical protein ALECFALPRED_009116 [Alectoria fallacina]
MLFAILGAAISHFFGIDPATIGSPAVQDKQMAHVRQVRLRNLMWAERKAGEGQLASMGFCCWW